MVRILLADDHQIVREGFRELLERNGFDVVAEAEDGENALMLARLRHPEVAVLDVSMPRLNGIDCARALLRDDPTVGVIALTVHSEEQQIVEALRAGVRGYVVKTQAAGELVRAIREVQTGGVYLSAPISRLLVNAYLQGGTAPSSLTPRQVEVLQLIADGHSTREISTLIGVSEKSAELYRARIMARLNIHDTAGLVRYAIRAGIAKL